MAQVFSIGSNCFSILFFGDRQNRSMRRIEKLIPVFYLKGEIDEILDHGRVAGRLACVEFRNG